MNQKRAENLFEKAYAQTMDGKPLEAIATLNEATQLVPEKQDAWFALADLQTRTRQYPASIASYEKAFSLGGGVQIKSYLLPYSISLAGAGRFSDALTKVNEYLLLNMNEASKTAGESRKKHYLFALETQKTQNKHYSFIPQNPGNGINTTDLEYLPSFTADGNRMIFTRRGRDEDFYESKRENGSWSKAELLKGKLNTNFNEGAQNIAQDGSIMIYTGCNYPEGEGSCDLYVSVRNANGEWSEGQNLGRIINSESWESSPALSPDKRDLYFASNRPGGFGGADIWVSHRTTTGGWSKPENAGELINTQGEEGTPFIHPDNLTLYFSSNGHPGYGGKDIYLSRRNATGEWTAPVNLGYPVNTIDEESSLAVSPDGRTAFYASETGALNNGLDLFSFELPENARAKKTRYITGRIFDKKTGEGLESFADLIIPQTGYLLTRLQTDKSGQYLTLLPEGQDFALNVNRKGYLFYSEHFAVNTDSQNDADTVDIPLQKIEANSAIVLKNIFFDYKSAELKPESHAELDRMVALLNDNPGVRVEIGGHTDNVGGTAYNQTLSTNRAKAVVAYLIAKGIAATRVTAIGYGEKKPVASNDTEEGRAKNRRTELLVIGI